MTLDRNRQELVEGGMRDGGSRDSLCRLVRRLDELGEQSAGEIGQEMWLTEWRGIPDNTIATRYCRPAGKLLKEAQRRGWVTSREGRNRRLWRVTSKGRIAVKANDRAEARRTNEQ